MRDVRPIPLWTYPLSSVNKICVWNSVLPLQVTDAHAVVHGDPAERVPGADDVITAIIVVTGTAIIIPAWVVSAGDRKRLTGIDIVGISYPRVRRNQRGQRYSAIAGDFGEPVTGLDVIRAWARRPSLRASRSGERRDQQSKNHQNL